MSCSTISLSPSLLFMPFSIVPNFQSEKRGNMKNSKSHWKRKKLEEEEALNVTAENQFPISWMLPAKIIAAHSILEIIGDPSAPSMIRRARFMILRISGGCSIWFVISENSTNTEKNELKVGNWRYRWHWWGLHIEFRNQSNFNQNWFLRLLPPKQ